jgi:alginate O-acetyltransferase complex protein AlgI
MVFNSDVFLLAFLPIVFALFWIARTRQQRYLILTVSGYVFYGYWNWKFCFLLLFSSLVSFAAGLLIDRSSTRFQRNAVLIGSIGVDLALLGYFKYYGFAATTVNQIASSQLLPILEVALPIGISFYTFHTISYVVDVWQRRIRATSNIAEYLTYVSLFSQLVAGPIVRFRQIEDDLERIDGPPRVDAMARGIALFTVGLIKKVVIADSIAAYLDPMIAQHQDFSIYAAWAAAFGYALQLYFDFSGYSDMAMGLGLMFGVSIPINFHSPYQAVGMQDFWRRWHISLSSWLRDYLYIPLGGSRRGEARTNVNLLATMLIGGLWHGANWTFVVWGAYHGLLLVAERLAGPALKRLPAWLYGGVTFLLVVVGWVIFRSNDLSMAGAWLTSMAGAGGGTLLPDRSFVLLVAAALLAVKALPEPWELRYSARPAYAAVYAVGFVLSYLVMNGKESVFLYFQF